MATGKKPSRATRPCYVGTHRQRAHETKTAKILEAKGTVACEQPTTPALNAWNPSSLPGVIANLG